MAVGRSAKTLRLFVTCYDAQHKTIMRMYDRNLNEELPAEQLEMQGDSRLRNLNA